MREPIVHAKAGREPRPAILSMLEDIRIRIASPYAPTPTSIDNRLFVLDLSQYEDVAMEAIKAFLDPRVQALIIRIGGSASVRDTKFELFWNLAREFKIPRSIYTYNWPGWMVDQHIRNFMESVELWTPGDLGEGPIWVDVECHADKSRVDVSNHSIDYITGLERETGKIIGWYSAEWFLNGYMQEQAWMREKLAWWAAWLYNQPREHPGPVSHPAISNENMVMHQTGSNCDARLFDGSSRVDTDRWQAPVEKFYELYGAEPPTPPQPGDLEEQMQQNTADIASLYERVIIIDEHLRTYDDR